MYAVVMANHYIEPNPRAYGPYEKREEAQALRDKLFETDIIRHWYVVELQQRAT